MERIKKQLSGISGKECTIIIKHALYGNQTIQCVFNPILTKDKIGFVIGDQKIFMYINDIIRTENNAHQIKIESQLVQYNIKVLGT